MGLRFKDQPRAGCRLRGDEHLLLLWETPQAPECTPYTNLHLSTPIPVHTQ